MRMITTILLAACLGSFAACSHQLAVEPTAPQVLASISDGAHGGQEHFYFLPPLVAQPDFGGIFDPSRTPIVEVCALQVSGCEPVVAEYSMSTGPGSETVRVDTTAQHYIVNFHTDAFDLEDGQVYRIRVLLEGQEAGHVDILPLANGQEVKNAATEEEIPLVNGRTLPIKFRIEEGLEMGNPVPAEPPDSTPQAVLDEIYDEANIIDGAPFMTGRMPSDIIWIAFVPDATQSQRQEAVDLIDGEVVGGFRIDPGAMYFVRIPTDGTAEALFDAIETLGVLPQVSSATPDISLEWSTLYRRPEDGANWMQADWQLDPGDAAGANWGLEYIAAPLAWGCSTGDGSVTVGIVDTGFHNVDDLQQNYLPSSILGILPSEDHGTRVSSVVGARGDNGIGMTGVMWQVGMHLEDYGARAAQGDPAFRPYQALVALIQAGTPIINLSSGYYWLDIQGRPPTQTRADSARVRAHADVMHRAMTSYRFTPSGQPPLFVVSAGNDGIDAWWNGVPQVADSADVRDLILVVAASDAAGGLRSTSNRNVTRNLVAIAAPGSNVSVLDASSAANVVADNGTSFSAPFVAGVAGLLKAFDPELTAVEVRQFILEGAVRGGQTAGGIPILNAYESLKAAAERPAAPLCGNQVWAAGGTLLARRTPGAPAEVLASVGSPTGQVEVLHGGKYIRYLTPGATHFLAWDSSTRTWETASQPSDFAELRAGAHASLLGQSHTRDSVAIADVSGFAGTRWYETQASEQVPVLVGEFTGSPATAGQITVNDLPGALQNSCLERDAVDHTCIFSVRETREWLFRLAYPQFPTDAANMERLAHITVSPLKVVREDSMPWGPCSFDATHECRVMTFRQRHAESTVYKMNLTGNGNVPDIEQTIADTSVFWIAHDEHGEDLVLERGRWSITLQADAAHFYQTGSPYFGQLASVETCEMEYRNQDGFGRIGSPIAEPDGCNFGLLNFPSQGGGAGTVAPSVLAPELVASRSITGLGITGTTSSMNSSTATTVPLPVYGHDPAQGLVELGQ